MNKINSSLLREAGVAAAIIAALILLINPFNLLMTSALVLTLIMLLALSIIAFGVFLWQEQPRDEREAFNGLKSSRISYFCSAIVLVTAVIVQALQHRLDIWLALALGAMVLSKLIMSVLTRDS